MRMPFVATIARREWRATICIRSPALAGSALFQTKIEKLRSEERRVGEEGRTRWAASHLKTQKEEEKGIRDKGMYLEFRRVLFRSVACDDLHPFSGVSGVRPVSDEDRKT